MMKPPLNNISHGEIRKLIPVFSCLTFAWIARMCSQAAHELCRWAARDSHWGFVDECAVDSKLKQIFDSDSHSFEMSGPVFWRGLLYL